jgi:hypothetical protein
MEKKNEIIYEKIVADKINSPKKSGVKSVLKPEI